MIKVQLNQISQCKVMPWASGTGSTTELAIYPPNSQLSNGSALWRVSMAQVPQSSPFSVLPQYDRILTVVSGDGFHLTGNRGMNLDLLMGEIQSFSGAEVINCRLLGGPCVDLNVFYQQDIFRAHLNLLGASVTQAYKVNPEKDRIIVVCLEGRTVVGYGGGKERNLTVSDSLVFSTTSQPATLTVKTLEGSRAAVIRIIGKS